MNREDLINESFADMMPYNEEEIQSAIKRLQSEPDFIKGIRHFMPEWTDDMIFDKAKLVLSSKDFQREFMYPLQKRNLSQTSSGFSSSGIENLDFSSNYLFIANHRDIFLDSSLLEMVFLDRNQNTTQVAVGNNLLSSQFLVDIAKINKMISVDRNGDLQILYKNSNHLSGYIRKLITYDKESLWIAQRNGRTKDGNDRTQPSLLKMLNMSGTGDFIKDFRELNIIPVTISYEYEPCDAQKVNEIIHSSNEVYVKGPNEDFDNIVSGILGFKGKIHLAFGKPINDNLLEIDKQDTLNAKIKSLIYYIDRQMHRNYKLMKTNYMAFDLLEETKLYDDQYTNDDLLEFRAYVDSKIDSLHYDRAISYSYFLKLYAYPVYNSTTHL
jgi:hypothetical protein